MSAETLQRNLRSCARGLKQLQHRFYKNKGDLHMLHIIYKKYPDGVSPSVLAKHMDISLPTVSQKISVLEESGLIARLPVETDKRKTVVKVTRQGAKELDEAFGEFLSTCCRIYGKLGEEKGEQLSALLEEIYRYIQEELEETE